MDCTDVVAILVFAVGFLSVLRLGEQHMPRVYPRKTLRERLLCRIKKLDSGCWIYTGHVLHDGYGQIGTATYNPNKHLRAHRASWIVHFGEIPEGMCVCHKCDTPLCCNPEHLFLGTPLDNNRDRNKKGRNANVCGNRNPMAILHQTQVDMIRSLVEYGGSTYEEIGKVFGVKVGTVSAIVRNRRWKSKQQLSL